MLYRNRGTRKLLFMQHTRHRTGWICVPRKTSGTHSAGSVDGGETSLKSPAMCPRHSATHDKGVSFDSGTNCGSTESTVRLSVPNEVRAPRSLTPRARAIAEEGGDGSGTSRRGFRALLREGHQT